MKLFFPLMAALAFAALPAAAAPKFEPVDSPLMKPQSTDFVLGNPKAPVTIIEYASLSCPHCAKFHKKALPELTKNYIDTGKAMYILRPYPLNDPALKAGLLIDCVGETEGKDRYYTFARVLFEAQDKWAFDTSWMNALATFAKVGGVSPEKFDQCTTDSKREIKLLNMKRVATKELNVDHTPYLFINGHRFDDDPTVEKISAYVDSLMPPSPPAKASAKELPTKSPPQKKP